MRVLKFLNDLCNQGAISYTALGILNEKYGIKYSINPKYPELAVLNYDQIESPKYDPITRECRSLVLEMTDKGFNVVSRSFDRFFNYSEEPDKEYDITQMTAYEKVDGSLVGLFYTEKYGWLYRTRSMIMPEGSINGWDLTWKELIEEAIRLDMFDIGANSDMVDCTFIFEVVSPENRVVTRYLNRCVYLLGIREKFSGKYLEDNVVHFCSELSNWLLPKQYKFSTFKECADAAKDLRGLEEGYVLYNKTGIPCIKLKNPAYVAAHHLRGEGLNPKRMMQLIFMNETDEYLSIFPEDTDKFKPWMEANEAILLEMNNTYNKYSEIESKKEFALQVKDLCYSAVLFQARANKKEPVLVWTEQRESYKLKVLESYKNEYKD